MLTTAFMFIVSLALVVKGATLATKHAAGLASTLRLSTYAVGFIVIAVISILPETFIAINASLKGVSSFGLGMLFGSNIADLTLLFAALIFISGRSLVIESKILKNHAVYPLILLVPLALGFNGHFSRLEGAALVFAGIAFYYLSLKNGSGSEPSAPVGKAKDQIKHGLLLLGSMAILLVGSHFTVSSASTLAAYVGVSPILIGMLVVGLGTTMPEFFFSLKSVGDRDDALAVGDILGTVLADATIVVGILALMNPFFFPKKIIFITGAFMVVASCILFYFMKSERRITKKEAMLLFFFWLTFVLVEFAANGGLD